MSPHADVAVAVVIPAHDEEASIATVVDEVLAALPTAEVIVVDDGSNDGTWPALLALCAREPRARALRLRRRAGKSAALRAGIDAVSPHVHLIATLDGDGQDVGAELPRLVAALEATPGKGSLDVVGGRRARRADAWHKRAASVVFNAAVSVVTGVRMRDHNTGLKVARAEVFDEIPLHGDLHRFIYVLAHHRGFRIAEIDVAHRPRRAGRTKYGALRAITSLADLLLVRAHLALDGRGPQRLALFGFLTSGAGLLALAWLAFTWFAERANATGADYVPLMERPLLIYAVLAVVVGVNCLSLSYLSGMLSARDVRSPAVAERAGPLTTALPSPTTHARTPRADLPQ